MSAPKSQRHSRAAVGHRERPIEIEEFPSGERTDLRLPLYQDALSRPLSVPFVVVRGRHPGPVLGVSAAVHGDELNGIKIIHHVLAELDPEPEREGLVETPRRVEKAFRFYTSGYAMDPRAAIGDALFEPETDEMVVVKDIEIYSLCEHHLAPFYGKAHVAYVPSGKIVGLSKIARVVDVYARRLQVQERLTQQIAEAIDAPSANAARMVVSRALLRLADHLGS